MSVRVMRNDGFSVLAFCWAMVACGEDAGAPRSGDDASQVLARMRRDASADVDRPARSARSGSDAERAGASASERGMRAAGSGGTSMTRAADAGVPAMTDGERAAQQADDAGAPVAGASFHWELPPGFPAPVIPRDNPMSAAKVELGRRLFYDKRLSGNETQSCASCHQQALAFTDGRATGLGSTGASHPRSSPALVNLAYATSLTWANPLFAIGVLPEPLERQTQIPMYGDAPVELGMKSQSELIARLREEELYRIQFAQAFPEQSEPLNAQSVGRALAAFERVLISGDAPYDRFMQGDDSALTESQHRGHALFTSDRLECSSCHSGFDLTEHVQWEGKTPIELVYRNTGLYNIDGAGAYPAPNTGAFNVTMDPDDMGKFRVPSLRNIAVTAPYMHDGSIATLSEVIDHYAAGGRTILEGPNAGVGSDNPLKDPRIHGFEITEAERADLIAFLGSLTDEGFLTNSRFSDPWLQH